MPDALRFAGEVRDADGTILGEARFWGSAERGVDGAPWPGWLYITDLGTNDLPAGRYHVRVAAGWEAEFEPTVTKVVRVFETDLLPITGCHDAPWPDQSEQPPHYQPVWNDTPPRTADDRLPSGLGADRHADINPTGFLDQGEREAIDEAWSETTVSW